MNFKTKRAVVIMAKAPVAGAVKTRLQPFLSGAQCAALAERFLHDTVNKTKVPDARLIIAFAPPEQRNFFENFTDREITACEQRGNDLGEKIYSAFQSAFARNSDFVVVIGTDSPTFPPEFIEQSFELLETGADAVLGKTADGGFYLIGLRAARKEIFDNIEWSSPRTFSQTKENILRLKLNLKEIAEWYDVDEPTDLRKLAKDFERNEAAQKIASETFKWLEQNIKPLFYNCL